MKPQSSLRELPSPVAIKPRDAAVFWDEVNNAFEKISKCAYELFESHGRQNGHDLDDWLQAESELLKPLPVEISEKDNLLVVRAEVPEFKVEELEVGLEPAVLIIKGKQENETTREVDGTIYPEARNPEARNKEILRKIPLPFHVNPDTGEAFLNEGVLEIRAPKALEAPAVLEVKAEEARKSEVAA